MSALIGNPLLLTSAPADDDAYQIEKSLRFDETDKTYLEKKFGTGNTRNWTLAFWYKKSKEWTSGKTDCFLGIDGDISAQLKFNADNKLQFDSGDNGEHSGVTPQVTSTAIFRDFSAWYHIVYVFDSVNPDAGERMRIYVNGKRLSVTTNHQLNQYEKSLINAQTGASTHHFIGREGGGGSSGYCGGYMADVHFIDGISLSPAAFGSFDSTGAWNPKAFALPAPNTGTTWSNAVDTTTMKSGYPWTKAFDGVADGTYGNGASANNGDGWARWTPTGGITVKASLRLNTDNGDTSAVKVKFSSGTNTSVQHLTELTDGWNDVEGTGTLEYIEIYNLNTVWSYLCGIEVDGVILVDGKTDSSTRNNPNVGITWSNFLTPENSWYSGSHGAANAFDGTPESGNAASTSGNLDTITFAPTTPITVNSSISLFYSNDGTQGTGPYRHILDGVTVNYTHNNTDKWIDMPEFAGKTISNSTPLTVERVTSGDNTISYLHGIKVDGHLLVDSTVDNSFHLKFNDTARNSALGKDTLNGKIDDATGGLPILTTTDDYGEVKGSGNRTDSLSSNLKLAIAGDSVSSTAMDVSSADHDVTVDGVTVSTDESRLYGSSLKFVSSDTHRLLVEHADFAMGTGDLCVEFWVYNTTNKNYNAFVGTRESANNTASGWVIASNASGYLYVYAQGVLAGSLTSEHVLPLNTWCHVAYTRASGKHRLFLNGVEAATSTTTSRDFTEDELTIGDNGYAQDEPMNGYMQDIRVYKGAAKYTTNFTPPNRNDWKVSNLLHASRGLNIRYYHDDSNTSFDSNSPSGDLSAVASKWITNPAKHTNNTGYGTNQNGVTAVFAPGGQGGSGTATFTFTGKDQVYLASSTNGGASWSGTGEKRQIYSGGDDYEYQISNVNAVAWAGGSSDNWTQVVLSSMSSSEQEPAKDIDSNVDSPTNYGTDTGAGGEVRGNYATLNPLQKKDSNLSQGNLFGGNTANTDGTAYATIRCPASGVWYCEATFEAWTAGGNNFGIGVDTAQTRTSSDGLRAFSNTDAKSRLAGFNDTYMFSCPGSGGGTNIGTLTLAKGDVWQCCWDVDNGKLYYGKNNTWYTSAGPSSGAAFNASNHFFSEEFLKDGGFFYLNGYDATGYINFGQRAWKYTPPLNAKALCTQNLDNLFDSETSENNPSKYFDVKTWTGDGQDNRNIGGLGFQPDLVWLKLRPNAADGYPYNHNLYDAVRGAGHRLEPNDTAISSSGQPLDQFNSDGFRVDNNTQVNESGKGYVSWNWDAGTAASGANNDGSINVSSGNQWKNATAGFSITKYTGTGANATVGHGLGAKPDLIIFKRTNNTENWNSYHSAISATKLVALNTTSAASDTDDFQDTEPTNTVFSIGTGTGNNGNGDTYMAYAWTAIPGYSAFGKYTGNGNADGPFIYTGFKPKWLMIKKSSSGAEHWRIVDTERDIHNLADTEIYANSNVAENTSSLCDILSNGFKIRVNYSGSNSNNETYIYAAFARFPFKTTRAR